MTFIEPGDVIVKFHEGQEAPKRYWPNGQCHCPGRPGPELERSFWLEGCTPLPLCFSQERILKDLRDELSVRADSKGVSGFRGLRLVEGGTRGGTPPMFSQEWQGKDLREGRL